jgi:hypothetical protein
MGLARFIQHGHEEVDVGGVITVKRDDSRLLALLEARPELGIAEDGTSIGEGGGRKGKKRNCRH